IFVNSINGDMMFPATAALVAQELDLAGTCDAFDVANACMGFLSALDIATRSVATGLGPVGIAVAEATSRTIHPGDHRPYLVFGDAIAAAVVGRPSAVADPDQGVLATFLGNDASAPDEVFAETPQLTGVPGYSQFLKSSAETTVVAMRALKAGIDGLLARVD